MRSLPGRMGLAGSDQSQKWITMIHGRTGSRRRCYESPDSGNAASQNGDDMAEIGCLQLKFGRMKSAIFGLAISLSLFVFAQSTSANPVVVYGEDLQNDSGVKALREKLEALGASRYSNFPYVTQVGGHTFVYFSHLKIGRHGGGAIPVIAIRRQNADRWLLETLFEPNGKTNTAFLDVVKDLGVTKVKPIFLREYVVFGYPNIQLQKLTVPEGNLRPWGQVQYVADESKYIRTAYNDGASWLVESDQFLGPWVVRRSHAGSRCAPIAKQEGLDFSEAAVAQVRRGHWIALIREDSGAAKKQRALYQAESFDKGCTWTTPTKIGDGTQPNIIRIDVGKTEHRLVMCVGDRTPLGMTADLGIQCRVSSNLASISEARPVRWGPARMIFRAVSSGDLGQPQSIQGDPETIDTYFYADRGKGTATDILVVRHRLSELVPPNE